MKYIVNLSGGLSSYAAAKRTIEQKGKENTVLVFADVKGDPKRDIHAAPEGTHWDGEHEDVYRFLDDIERLFDLPINRLHHPRGLGVWGAIFEARAIVLRGQANTFAPCTKRLKMETMDAFVESIRGQEPARRVLGLNWMEDDRVAKFRDRVDSDVWFPMTEPPYLDNCHIVADLETHGIKPPSMYADGFPHANCGGACIKAGQAQWAALLRLDRGRYLYNEEQEEWFRRDINPDVAILRDRSGGTTKALPLRELRLRLEDNPKAYDRFEWGGCGCFAPSPQMRMDSLLIEVAA